MVSGSGRRDIAANGLLLSPCPAALHIALRLPCACSGVSRNCSGRWQREKWRLSR